MKNLLFLASFLLIAPAWGDELVRHNEGYRQATVVSRDPALATIVLSDEDGVTQHKHQISDKALITNGIEKINMKMIKDGAQVLYKQNELGVITELTLLKEKSHPPEIESSLPVETPTINLGFLFTGDLKTYQFEVTH